MSYSHNTFSINQLLPVSRHNIFYNNIIQTNTTFFFIEFELFVLYSRTVFLRLKLANRLQTTNI